MKRSGENQLDNERRAHRRVDLHIKVEYPRMEDFVEDYSLNISRGGMMVSTDHVVRVGDILEMALSVPRIISPINVRGVVRWVRTDPSSGERTAGIEFLHDSETSKVAFERIVDRVLAGDQSVVARETVSVLVADGNRYVAELIGKGLEGYGKRCQSKVDFDTHHAVDGGAALRTLESQRFDLLVVDLSLALLDGQSLIRKIRSNSDWEQLAIVAVGQPDDERVDEALRAGADFFLSKPLRLADVLNAMSRLVILSG